MPDQVPGLAVRMTVSQNEFTLWGGTEIRMEVLPTQHKFAMTIATSEM
jgi:hypothetical protein